MIPKRLIEEIVSLARPFWKQFIVGVFLLICSSGFGLMMPLLAGEVVDCALDVRRRNEFPFLLTGLAIVQIGSTAFHYYYMLVLSYIDSGLAAQFKSRLV